MGGKGKTQTPAGLRRGPRGSVGTDGFVPMMKPHPEEHRAVFWGDTAGMLRSGRATSWRLPKDGTGLFDSSLSCKAASKLSPAVEL